jgi:mannose-6-phosphate isomerase-like protein (cupin superfamily)
MKTKTFLFFPGLLFLGCIAISCCNQNQKNDHAEKAKVDVILKDYGAKPTVLDIDAYTLANENFVTALWTGTNLQVTLMSIPVGGDIGLEQHLDNDQFLRIEDGQAKVMMGDDKDSLTFVEMAEEDYAVFIPAGMWHNIINTGDRPLKLYSVYAPAEHPHSAVYKTQKEAEEAHQH